MAKQSLPSVDDGPAVKQPQQQKQVVVETKTTITESYQFDLAAFRNANVNLPQKHRILMRNILRHLQDSGARLADGTEVTDKTKSVLWLLENAALPKEM